MLITKNTGYVCTEKRALVGKDIFNASFSVNQLNCELRQQVSALGRTSKLGGLIFDTKTILNENSEGKGKNKNGNDEDVSKTIEDEVIEFGREITEDFANDAMQTYVDKYYKTSYRY